MFYTISYNIVPYYDEICLYMYMYLGDALQNNKGLNHLEYIRILFIHQYYQEQFCQKTSVDQNMFLFIYCLHIHNNI